MIKGRDTQAYVQGQERNLSSGGFLVSMKLSNIHGDLVMEFTRKIAVSYSDGINAAVKDLMTKALKE